MAPEEDRSVSSPISQLWAKSGPASQWHPLAAHMVDAIHVARRIWRAWLAPATRRWLSAPFGDNDSAEAYFSWLAGCHDLGKASPAFQIQVDWLAVQVRAAGLPLPNALPERRRAPHAKVSAVAIGPLLEAHFGWDRRHTVGPAAILGGHHGWFPVEGYTREGLKRPALFGWSTDLTAPWMAARSTLFSLAVSVAGAEGVLHASDRAELGRARELALAGYVVLADWIASNADLFPYTSAPFDAAYIEESAHRAEHALDRIGWHRWESEGKALDFQRRFGFAPNALQRQAIVTAEEAGSPGLMIVEGPMGIGKTEAALAAVEVLAASHGLGGTFIALPTQATSNQMFSRAKSWLERLGSGTYVMELAHGKAGQVTEYKEIQHFNEPACIDVGEGSDAQVTAADWFHGPKRRLLAPFVVGTVDQALLCAAKVRHVALRQVGLLGKAIVIDEVHAYDSYTSVFLRRALRWLGAAGVPVILLSATLPPDARRRLAEAYTGGPVVLADIGYPAVTHIDPEGDATSNTVELEHPPRRAALRILDEAPDRPISESFVETVAGMARRGANVLVVRNTVARAQDTARSLRHVLGAESVTLLHARFVAGHRLDREVWLARRFGPSGDRPSGHVVVGTQVLEQSLDVDFDVLITDLAPIDLVLQRAGRVHRHLGIVRPEGFEDPLIIIAGVERTATGPPRFPSGSRYVYGEHLLLRTAALLVGTKSIVLPGDLPDLVTRVYGTDAVVPADWGERADAAALEWNRKERAAEKSAEQFAIPPPESAPNLLELCRIGITDPDDDDPAVQAAVRDAPVTIEVVVGWEGETQHQIRCIGGTVPLQRRPTPEEVNAALSSTLRVTIHVPRTADGVARRPLVRA